MGAHTNGRDAQRVLDHIRRIVQSLRESARATESKHGISSAQLFVLQKLHESGSGTVGELAQRTVTHQSSVSVVVGRLEKVGLVKRAVSKNDRRAVLVSLTTRGNLLARAAPDPTQLRLLHGLSRLSVPEQRKLAALLGKVVDAMGLEQTRPPSMFFEERRK